MNNSSCARVATVSTAGGIDTTRYPRFRTRTALFWEASNALFPLGFVAGDAAGAAAGAAAGFLTLARAGGGFWSGVAGAAAVDCVATGGGAVALAVGVAVDAAAVCGGALGGVGSCLGTVVDASATGCCLMVAGAFALTFFAVPLLTGGGCAAVVVCAAGAVCVACVAGCFAGGLCFRTERMEPSGPKKCLVLQCLTRLGIERSVYYEVKTVSESATKVKICE